MKKKDLLKLAKSWREYANGHYAQTYNKGMAQAMLGCAEQLESALNKSAQHRVQSTPLSLSSAEITGEIRGAGNARAVRRKENYEKY